MKGRVRSRVRLRLRGRIRFPYEAQNAVKTSK